MELTITRTDGRRTLAAGTSPPWPVVVEAYLDADVDSPHTRRAYERHLNAALGAIGKARLPDITGADLAALRHAVTGSEAGPATQDQALAALRSFLKWATTVGAAPGLNGDVVRLALRGVKGEVRKPYRILTDHEVRAMLCAATTPRDKALLGILLGAGLRAAEVVGVDVADIINDDEGYSLHVRQGKGRKDRIVPIRHDVAELVCAYLDSTGRGLGEEGPLFRSHDRGAASRSRPRLSTRAVGHLVARVADRAGIKGKTISPHSLRHTSAVRSLRAGANVVAVSKILGHSNISTTQKYLDHLGLAELREAVAPLPVEP